MKILYITLEDLSLHKGSVTHIKEIVAGLQKRGHQVGLIGRPWKSIVLSSLFLLISLFGKLPQYDVIYARDYHTVILALLPRLFFRKKLVYEINGIANEEQKLKKDSFLNRILVFLIEKAERMATKHSERIVSVTPQIGAYLNQNYDCSKEKIKVITNGVNMRKFYPIHDDALLLNWRRKLGILEEEIVIAFVGNLAPWQGVETLIEVAPFLLKEVKNIKFLIIGDGILKKAFKEKVNNLGVTDHFVFAGMVNHQEIPFYINIADICVLPKRRLKSGYSPIKLYEYMACGKPVVASRVEGLEFIEEEGIGRLVEPGDVMRFQEELLDLIKNPEKGMMMGNKGLLIAREKFDWELKSALIEKVLKELA
jgi:alpha-maltose-1-phosphate synthase